MGGRMDRRIIKLCQKITTLDKDYRNKKARIREMSKVGIETPEDREEFLWLINNRERSEDARDYLIKLLILEIIRNYSNEVSQLEEEVREYEKRN